MLAIILRNDSFSLLSITASTGDTYKGATRP